MSRSTRRDLMSSYCHWSALYRQGRPMSPTLTHPERLFLPFHGLPLYINTLAYRLTTYDNSLTPYPPSKGIFRIHTHQYFRPGSQCQQSRWLWPHLFQPVWGLSRN
ncbi:hypothetical protein RSOL_392550 [Rhizoctonia solani AG-3 Rhs1AP]|uniref:Uncharacterized protein n=2 Tax=Rhizoctonia solani AG-3 TaxID=1086053 RepID=A0A074RZP6_9AGAM|nr:hypothetical protein RSOL_392550 [Rhizoctonia solani AG-3 Rhs1AP]KEP52494.1 hypothetical protein V565_044350 [Rhizoctonia solani 123E]